jgi:hypothetical protein
MVEDITVFEDAIQFLEEIEPLEPLIWDDNLALSSLEHVLDIGPKGLLRFEGSDGTSVEDRIKKYGNYIEHLGESIDYGPNDAMGVLVSLILDDGEQEKPDRYNLFRPDYKKVGIACGPHKTEYQITVFDFAYDFVGHDENEMEGEEYIEFSQNKIDPNESSNNIGVDIKSPIGSDNLYSDKVVGGFNLNRSGYIENKETNEALQKNYRRKNEELKANNDIDDNK